MLKNDLKLWNRDVLGNLDLKKSRILNRIEKLDCQDADGELEGSARMERMELISQMRVTNKKIESLTSQKARVNWLKHGESRSRYYHSILRWRRLRNDIKGVEFGGQWCEEPEVIKKEAKKLFQDRFVATKDVGVRISAVEFKTLSMEENLSLIVEFTEEEVREAVWQCDSSKSLGPDG